jgi:hypothetical protein
MDCLCLLFADSTANDKGFLIRQPSGGATVTGDLSVQPLLHRQPAQHEEVVWTLDQIDAFTIAPGERFGITRT